MDDHILQFVGVEDAMERKQFDGWAQGFTARVSRRGLGIVVAAAMATTTTVDSEAKKKHKKKKSKSATCPGGCPERKFCFATGCVCNGGLITCGDNCCLQEEEVCLADGTCGPSYSPPQST